MFARLAVSTAASLFIAACGGGATDARASTVPADSALPGELVVKLRFTADLQGVLATHQLSLAGAFGARPIYRLSLVGAADLNAKLAALTADARVMLAEPNFQASSPEARKSSVWAIGSQGEYTAQWAPQSLNLAQAHTLASGAGMRVALLDTGVDLRHPALAGRLLAGRDFVDGDTDPSEGGAPGQVGYGHGTHVAGLVALTAPSAKIMPLRVLDASGLGNTWVIAEALLYAVDPDGVPATDDGAQIINLSLGTTQPTRLLDVVIELITCSDDDEDEDDDDYSDPGYNADKERCNTRSGSVVIAAAGNGASATEKQFPAAEAAEGALSVAASNANSRLASFSNSGNWIQIGAPGEGITSTVPGGGYGVWSGTSMAAPITAGVAALVWSRNPAWKPVDVTKRITERSATLCGTALRRVDAAAAVADFVPPATVCP